MIRLDMQGEEVVAVLKHMLPTGAGAGGCDDGDDGGGQRGRHTAASGAEPVFDCFADAYAAFVHSLSAPHALTEFLLYHDR